MLKILSFLAKKPELTTAEFIDYYEHHHVPLICGLLGAPSPVYKRNYLRRDEPGLHNDDAVRFDVVTELVFDDRRAFEAWSAQLLVPDVGARVKEDEARFLNHAHYLSYVVEEHVTTDKR